MKIVAETKAYVPVIQLCAALGLPRSTAYRRGKPRAAPVDSGVIVKTRRHARRLTTEERCAVLELLHGERFADKSPAHVWATLLDEGRYLCSERTMYRILAQESESRERRAVTRHGKCAKPELLATGPNQVWSWDITKLMGPEKWTYFYLYVIIDIFSRCVVGWMVAERELGTYARSLIEQSLAKHEIPEGQLTIHSDRGGPMISKPVAFLLADLGVTKSFGRPQTSNDNPFSEAHFKTLKYCPEFPDRFGSLEDAQSYCRRFFAWYNHEHKHSGIGYYCPADVHSGRASDLERIRNQTLAAAFERNP